MLPIFFLTFLWFFTSYWVPFLTLISFNLIWILHSLFSLKCILVKVELLLFWFTIWFFFKGPSIIFLTNIFFSFLIQNIPHSWHMIFAFIPPDHTILHKVHFCGQMSVMCPMGGSRSGPTNGSNELDVLFLRFRLLRRQKTNWKWLEFIYLSYDSTRGLI